MVSLRAKKHIAVFGDSPGSFQGEINETNLDDYILPTVMICVLWYTPLVCISVLVLEEYADDPDRV
jgi:hypothetical protein